MVYMAYEPMSNIPWAVITVLDVDEVLHPALEGQAKIAELSNEASEEISSILFETLLIFSAALLITMAVAATLGVTVSGRITRPLSHLTEEVERISGGKLDTAIRVETDDELETLADAFNSMTESLKAYIRDLTAATAEKERIGAELNVATKIQKDMLPNIFPAFPDRQEFNIYATMDPAKEVGGDFYDFFMVDDAHLAVVMADVSGKGVPAPLLRRKGGTYEYLRLDPGFVLAGLENMRYESRRLTLGEGDTLFLYTDGVTEALDPNEELFGEERLRDAPPDLRQQASAENLSLVGKRCQEI